MRFKKIMLVWTLLSIGGLTIGCQKSETNRPLLKNEQIGGPWVPPPTKVAEPTVPPNQPYAPMPEVEPELGPDEFTEQNEEAAVPEVSAVPTSNMN